MTWPNRPHTVSAQDRVQRRAQCPRQSEIVGGERDRECYHCEHDPRMNAPVEAGGCTAPRPSRAILSGGLRKRSTGWTAPNNIRPR